MTFPTPVAPSAFPEYIYSYHAIRMYCIYGIYKSGKRTSVCLSRILVYSNWGVYMIIFYSDWAVLPLLIGPEVSM